MFGGVVWDDKPTLAPVPKTDVMEEVGYLEVLLGDLDDVLRKSGHYKVAFEQLEFEVRSVRNRIGRLIDKLLTKET